MSLPFFFWYCGETSSKACGCCFSAHASCEVSEKTPSIRFECQLGQCALDIRQDHRLHGVLALGLTASEISGR